ncbi:MAG: ATP-binding protein [Planctomycetota bacterium]
MLVLHVIQGADRGRRFELPAGEPQLIGRSSEALPITDTTVSRRHAELTPDDDAWFIRDLESANGTFLNGHRLHGERKELAPGDQIRCGSTLLLFVGSHDGPRASTLQMINADALDVTVERTLTNSDSMILAAPDPVAAAMDHLRVIYDLHALTSGTLDRGELLERIMDLIFEEFRPDRGFILLGSDVDGALDPAVMRYRERPKTVDEGRIPVSRTIIRHTLEHSEGVLATNAMNDDRFRSGDSVRDYGIRSAVCVPIVAADRTFGVIHIDSSLANFTFTDSQLRLLTAVGQHTGLTLLSGEIVASRVQVERLAAMGEAVASLSHSIKNILQGLRGGADAVELALNRDDLALAKEGWPILARNLDRIVRLTLNMLAYSKPSTLDIELTDLNGLIMEVVELLRTPFEKVGAGVITELDPNMPPMPVDANAIHQVLMNLITNAIEAVATGEGLITIRSQYDGADHTARLEVTDNGPGIPPEWQEDIFEAFVSRKGQRGTGLGLSVSRKIVREHGGTITVRSQVGSGTTFAVVLPSDYEGLHASETRPPMPMSGDEFDQDF